MNYEFCTLIETCDDAVKILKQIESVSSVIWLDGIDSPTEWTAPKYPCYLICRENLSYGVSHLYGKPVTPSEFVNECARRMPK